MMQMEMFPRTASNRKGSNSLLSCTKKWRCSQKESVSTILVNLLIPLLDCGVTVVLGGYRMTLLPDTSRPSSSRQLWWVRFLRCYWKGRSWSSMRLMSSYFLSPITITSICSVIIWSSISYNQCTSMAILQQEIILLPYLFHLIFEFGFGLTLRKLSIKTYYKMQKVSAEDEERFNKAVQMYSKKYRLNISSLIKFIEEKIAVSQQTKNIILAEIVSSKNPEESISKEQLKLYLHLVAAAQAKVDIRGKKLESFRQFYRLNFNKSRIKEEGKPVPDARAQRKEEVVEKKKGEGKIDQQLKKEKAAEQPPPNNPQPPYKSRISRSSTSSPVKQKLQVIEQDVVDQNRTSNVGFRTESTQELLLKMPDAQMMSLQSEKSVRITGYDKFGQNYLNPIIKYHINFGEYSVYRRYSEFQRLMNDLSRRYEGFILPQLPPKEGIKSNLSYFWGVDEAFLNDRQVKLQEMLNILLSSKFVSKDDILERFLKEQDFQIEASSQGGLISYLKPITSIALNTKQLKNYGVAYYNYLKEFNRAEINTSVTVKYKEVQSLLNQCLAIDHYRNAINANFDKRRDVFKELKMDQNDRTLTISKFDKLSSSSASEIKNLSKEIGKYLELKSQESWLNYLIREKESQSEGDIEELRGSKEEIVARIATMEGNLLTSIEELRKEKVAYLEGVGDKMIEWRKAIHP